MFLREGLDGGNRVDWVEEIRLGGQGKRFPVDECLRSSNSLPADLRFKSCPYLCLTD